GAVSRTRVPTDPPGAGVAAARAEDLGAGRGRDRPRRQVRLRVREVRVCIRRRRRLRADLGLAVRGRLRAADPRPRARPLRRGAKARLRRRLARVHPVPRRLRRDPRRANEPVAERVDLARGAALRLRRRGSLLAGRRAARVAAAASARLRRVHAQPVQPATDRVPRRRLDLARDQDDAPRRHARQGDRRLGRLLRPRGAAAARDDRRARPAAPPLVATVDRRILEHDRVDLDEHVATIAEEFRMGFEAVDRVPRPAVTVFGSARIDADTEEYRLARECGRLLAEAGFAVVTGGGPGAKDAGGYSVGFNIELPHEQEPNPYLDLALTFRHFYARKVALVKAAEGFVL